MILITIFYKVDLVISIILPYHSSRSSTVPAGSSSDIMKEMGYPINHIDQLYILQGNCNEETTKPIKT